MIKNNGFTIIELLTVMCIIVLLIGLLVPSLQNIHKRLKEKEITETTTVVQVENGLAGLKRNVLCKVHLVPSFQGSSKSQIFMKDAPYDAKLIEEKEEYYLLWEPKDTGFFKMTVLTVNGSTREETPLELVVQ